MLMRLGLTVASDTGWSLAHAPNMVPLHVGGPTLRQNLVETAFLLAGVALFAAAFRVRRIRLAGHPVASSAIATLAAAALVLAFVVPSRLAVRIAATRPSTEATIAIVSPVPAQVFRGQDAKVPVRIRVIGARVVDQTSTQLSPHRGHIHLYLDGALVAMIYRTSTIIYSPPGHHRLKAEFVASDHGPFNPPVTTSVQFQVLP
jgi:hypothetical protein